MDALFVGLFYLARPSMMINVDIPVFGLSFFEAATIVFTGVLALIALGAVLSRRSRGYTSIDLWIFMWVFWLSAIFILYKDVAVFESYVKFILAPLTFLILKRAIRDRRQYARFLLVLIYGFSVPLVFSMVTIMQGGGFGEEVYHTGLQRYKGVFANIHNLGHSAGVMIMCIALWISIVRIKGSEFGVRLHKYQLAVFLFLIVIASYGLFKSHVRTVYVGLPIFLIVLLYCYDKRALVLAAVASTVVGAVFAAGLALVFHDFIDEERRGEHFERAGSGRFTIWKDNLDVYAAGGVDNYIAGLGIGNFSGFHTRNRKIGEAEMPRLHASHNDWLTLLCETGIVGLAISLALHAAIFFRIMTSIGREKYAFLAFLLAIMAMNMLSNAYVSRFPLAQLFYMVMVYVDLPVGQARRIAARRRSRSLRTDARAASATATA